MAVSFLGIALLILGVIAIVVFFVVLAPRSSEAKAGRSVGAKIVLAVLVLLITGFGFAFGPGLLKGLRARSLDPDLVIAKPLFLGEMVKGPDGAPLSVGYRLYGLGGYGVLDFGDLRLAVAGWEVSGTRAGSGYPVGPCPTDGPFAVTGPPSRADFPLSGFSYGFDTADARWVGGLARFVFTVEDGVLTVGGATWPVGAGPRIIFLEPDGTIMSVADGQATDPGR